MYQPTSLPGEWVFYGVETCRLRLPIAEQAKHDALQEAAGVILFGGLKVG
jgi:hypothetical protein